METRDITLNACKLNEDIKEDKDGKYYCLVRNTMISNKLESIFYIEFSKAQYEILKNLDYKNQLIKITGTVQARKNKKDIPFLYIKCHTVAKNKEEIIKPKVIPPKKNTNRPNKNKYINWSELVPNLKENLIVLDNNKIEVIEEIHKKGCIYFDLNKYNENYMIAVKPIENKEGYYYLVSGFKQLVISKMLNKPVNAYITDYSYNEFHKLFIDKKIEIE